ncbi:methionine-tRNA ligase [Cryptococcus depauperatus]|nr:methionine-tRNA ligase [Cryptococcus depauperatus CBS 7855]
MAIRHSLSRLAACSLRPRLSVRHAAIRMSSTATQPMPLSSPSLTLFDPQGDAATAKPFYVTTPIFYVNASPHIGHLHSLLLADVFARFSRLRHPDRKVIFATGTDEHGMKIQQAAKAMEMDEQAFCDDVSQRFRNLVKLANASNTDFIRTTEPRHYKAVEDFWGKLTAAGDIYKGTHAGWYSISDESFYAVTQVTKREDGKMVAIESGSEVVWEEETNWRFRLSKYKSFLREWLSNPNVVHPNSVRLNLISQIDTLEDLSVSRPRSRVKWGIPVPNDPEQSIYVWIDALINYLTVTGYPEKLDGWPADIHVVGKDIIKFHALHWPSLLKSASLPPPKRVIAHAHWTMNKTKMSKSKGNVVDPISAMSSWSVDGVRWYLIRIGGSLTDDADYAPDQLEVHYKLLAAQMGNLLSRISSSKILKKANREFDMMHDRDEELDTLLSGLREDFENKMENYMVNQACGVVMDTIMATNKLFTTLEPWSSPDSTKAITYAYHSLRLASILLQPIIPNKVAEALDRLGVPENKRRWEDAVWQSDASGANTETMVQRLKEGSKRWKSRGYLFPLFAKNGTT